MSREEILEYFKDINHAYNDCTRYDTLKRMIDELQEPCKVSEYDKDHIWYKGSQYISLRRFLEVKAEKPNKWIPVSERLPEWGKAVLTYHEDDDEYQINWVTDDETVEWFHENPIAWMPLPEPYVPDTNIGEMSEIPTGWQEPSREFAKWVASEIFDDYWEYNKDAFAEIACRKLEKLGIVRANGDKWELAESEE